MPEEELKEMIKEVGFFDRKAGYIKQLVDDLFENHGGKVPTSYENVMKLPGVGGKMAKMLMKLAFNENVGISVDAHVHRIANRLKWVHEPTKNPFVTAQSMEMWMPKQYWHEAS